MSNAAEPIVETPKLIELLGITAKDTTELKKIGALVPAAGRGRWRLRSSVQSYCCHLRRLVELKASDAATLNRELTAKKICKTDAEGQLAQLRLEIEKGRYVEAAAVFEEGVRIGSVLTAQLHALAHEAAGSCAGLAERDLHKALRGRIERVLSEFKKSLAAVDTPPVLK
jgi:hypothetical protein